MPRIQCRLFPPNKGLELIAQLLTASDELKVRNTFHDEDTAAFQIIMAVRGSVAGGDEDGDRLPLGTLEIGHDVHLARGGIEDEGMPIVVSAEHLATCKRDALYVPTVVRGRAEEVEAWTGKANALHL